MLPGCRRSRTTRQIARWAGAARQRAAAAGGSQPGKATACFCALVARPLKLMPNPQPHVAEFFHQPCAEGAAGGVAGGAGNAAQLAAAAAAGGGMSEQTVGLVLALSSSVFIGSSFVIKKRGLRRAGASGVRAGTAAAAGGRAADSAAVGQGRPRCRCAPAFAPPRSAPVLLPWLNPPFQAAAATPTCGSRCGGWGWAPWRRGRWPTLRPTPLRPPSWSRRWARCPSSSGAGSPWLRLRGAAGREGYGGCCRVCGLR